MGTPTGLYGNFALTEAEIDARVGESAGAYILGDQIDAQGILTVRYVGRSDSGLNSRLKTWIHKYKYFQYGHFSTAADAYDKECHLYHAFGATSLDNAIHPAKPTGSTRNCPVCGA